MIRTRNRLAMAAVAGRRYQPNHNRNPDPAR